LKSAGYILREEMFHLLKSTMVKQPTEEDPEEGIKDLVEIMMKRMVSLLVQSFLFQLLFTPPSFPHAQDADNDGKVTLEDFKKTVSSTPLLLESFGTCLPETKVQRSHESLYCMVLDSCQSIACLRCHRLFNITQENCLIFDTSNNSIGIS
jgi:hypothetical protein